MFNEELTLENQMKSIEYTDIPSLIAPLPKAKLPRIIIEDVEFENSRQKNCEFEEFVAHSTTKIKTIKYKLKTAKKDELSTKEKRKYRNIAAS